VASHWARRLAHSQALLGTRTATDVGRTGGSVASNRDRSIQRAMAWRVGAHVAGKLRGCGRRHRSASAGRTDGILPSVGCAAEQGSTGSVGSATPRLHRSIQRVGQSAVCSARLPTARHRKFAAAVGETELRGEPVAVHLQEEPGCPGVLSEPGLRSSAARVRAFVAARRHQILLVCRGKECAWPFAGANSHRRGIWPARRSMSSSVARAKRLIGVGPSAQTFAALGAALCP
jgi:hypothetical protein